MTGPNDRVKLVSEKTLSDGWTRLSSYELDYADRSGETHRLHREIYHKSEAACILLYDARRDMVVLVRQFRLPAYLTGKPAWMVEVPAGLLDEDHPEEAIRREAMEETGYRLRDVRFVFKAFMSPGAITELVHFFHAPVDLSDRVNGRRARRGARGYRGSRTAARRGVCDDRQRRHHRCEDDHDAAMGGDKPGIVRRLM